MYLFSAGKQSFACVQHEKKQYRIMGILPSRGVSNTNGRLCLSNSWGFYLPRQAARIILRRHILGVVPCKIPVRGCTVYIDYKSVCPRELSMGTKTYL